MGERLEFKPKRLKFGLRRQDDLEQTRLAVVQALEPGDPLGQGSDGTDKGLYVDGTPGDQIQTDRIFSP